MNRSLFTKGSYILSLISLLTTAPLLGSQTSSFHTIATSEPQVLKTAVHSGFEFHQCDLSYLHSLLTQGQTTLEWELPALTLKNLTVLGDMESASLTREITLSTRSLKKIFEDNRLDPKKSVILEYWRLSTLPDVKNPIDILVPKKIGLSIFGLKEASLGLVKGMIVDIDLRESDDSYKPKTLKHSKGKFVIVDDPRPKPTLIATPVIRVKTPSEEAWRSSL